MLVLLARGEHLARVAHHKVTRAGAQRGGPAVAEHVLQRAQRQSLCGGRAHGASVGRGRRRRPAAATTGHRAPGQRAAAPAGAAAGAPRAARTAQGLLPGELGQHFQLADPSQVGVALQADGQQDEALVAIAVSPCYPGVLPDFSFEKWEWMDDSIGR